ncbi:MAG: class I SAM-dependent methyltransferase [Bryobacteraceae bacterium]
MPELNQRIAGLSAEKQRLLEHLLTRGVPSASAARRPDTGVNASRSPLDGVRQDTRSFYDAVNKQLNASEVGSFSYFLNYGYAPDHNPQHTAVQLPEHYLHKNCVRLVLELVGHYPLANKRVLDVGCGRGGTIHVLRKFYNPGWIAGVDLSSVAVRFCKAAHGDTGAEFAESDAERLPFRDASFDAVTNVESSHSYPVRTRFYAEVWRVLAPGGWFHYTDLLTGQDWNHAEAELTALGFMTEARREITSNVLLSCDETAQRHRTAFGTTGSDPAIQEFLAVPGSSNYDRLQSRELVYNIVTMRKPEKASYAG